MALEMEAERGAEMVVEMGHEMVLEVGYWGNQSLSPSHHRNPLHKCLVNILPSQFPAAKAIVDWARRCLIAHGLWYVH